MHGATTGELFRRACCDSTSNMAMAMAVVLNVPQGVSQRHRRVAAIGRRQHGMWLGRGTIPAIGAPTIRLPTEADPVATLCMSSTRVLRPHGKACVPAGNAHNT